MASSIVERLRDFVPVPREGDPDVVRRAGLLRDVLLMMMGSAIVSIPFSLINAPITTTAITYGTFIGSDIAALYLLKRGRFALAASAFSAWLFLSTVIVTVLFGGLTSGTAIGFISGILIVSVLHGSGAAIVFAASSAAAVLAIAVVENTGRLPAPLVEMTLIETSLAHGCYILMVTYFSISATRSLTGAVRSARESATLANETARKLSVAQIAEAERAEQALVLAHLAEGAISTVDGRTVVKRAIETLLGLSTVAATALLEVTSSDTRVRFVRSRDNRAGAESDFPAFGKALAAARPVDGEPFLLVLNNTEMTAGIAIPVVVRRDGCDALLAIVTDRGASLADARVFLSTLGSIVSSALRIEQKEHELRQSQKMEAIGRLAGGVAHDFNNLLTSIGGSAMLLEDGQYGGESQSLAHDIHAAVDRASLLTKKLLAFSRKSEFRPVVLDVQKSLDVFLPVVKRLIPEAIEVRTDISVDSAHVEIDPNGLEQILLNLVINARDALNDRGTIAIDVRVLEAVPADHTVVGNSKIAGAVVAMSVRDTGTGIGDEERERLFEPFYTTKADGTGLGLSTVYGIVAQSGGAISLQSEIGVGATFTVFLPVAAAPVKTEKPTVASGPPLKILVVDDEPAVRNVARRILERAGHSVVVACTGDEALAFLDADGSIDMVLTDVVMPGMNGFELAENIRTHRDLPVVLISGYAVDSRRASAADVSVLAKPFSQHELIDAIAAAGQRMTRGEHVAPNDR